MVDSLYLREMAKKIKRGLEGQQARGFATGGRTFGYRSVPVPDPSGRREPNGHPAIAGYRVEIVPNEADAIRTIFERYASGVGRERITATLNCDGIKGPRGHRWKLNAVKRAAERTIPRAVGVGTTHV